MKGKYLLKGVITYMKNYSNEQHETPPPEKFDIINCPNSSLTTDTYNQAIKSRSVMKGKVPERERELSSELLCFCICVICNNK